MPAQESHPGAVRSAPKSLLRRMGTSPKLGCRVRRKLHRPKRLGNLQSWRTSLPYTLMHRCSNNSIRTARLARSCLKPAAATQAMRCHRAMQANGHELSWGPRLLGLAFRLPEAGKLKYGAPSARRQLRRRSVQGNGVILCTQAPPERCCRMYELPRPRADVS